MNFAFCLFNFYPYGGLEQSFLNISKQALVRGHTVDVFTCSWEGDIPAGLQVKVLPCKAWSNHALGKKYVAKLEKELALGRYDAVVGFNRMPGLDVYYNADVSFVVQARKKHGAWYRLMPRYRLFAAFERAVFEAAAATHILYISPRVKTEYQTEYDTSEARWHALPPGINKQRIEEALVANASVATRAELGLELDDTLLLMIGSDFKRKGVDRALHALAALPDNLREKTALVVIGQGDIETYTRLAQRLAVDTRLRLLGPRQGVARFLAAADMLLHPALSETAGNAIVEGLVAGLPVLVTASCGFSFHVQAADAGLLIPDEPYRQEQFNTLLQQAIDSDQRPQWQANARHYAVTTDLYSRPLKAVETIESIAERKRASLTSL
ncbi:MAG: glycosyltransferase family 4 protein [Pseudomonadales bacterium]